MPGPLKLQRALLDWSDGARRDLPWRATRDPWAVLVSELMLQQTQVARVVDRWAEFLERFPTVGTCAAAPAGDVLRLWSGLGYNRRALNLHRAALAIVGRHHGVVPDDLAALQSLPGIGPYTARAVLAFAFERDVAVLDTNAARVVARAAAGRRLAMAEAQRLADALVPGGEGWRWNQAMLDLGATVCTKRRPRCERCPLSTASACGWMAAGRPEPDPAVGSAAVSGTQPRFAGSDRQGRGRLLDALRAGPVAVGAVADAAGWPEDPARADRIAAALVAEGLAVRCATGLALPG